MSPPKNKQTKKKLTTQLQRTPKLEKTPSTHPVPLSPMSTINLTQYAKVFTARLRSRAHSQAFVQAFQERKKKQLSPTAKTAFKKVDELETLARLYRGTYDPGVKSKAIHLLQVLPLPLSTEEDPHFILATRVLRAAGNIGAAQHPLTSTLLMHCAKHSFLLDGFNLVKLLQAMRQLPPAQIMDALLLLLPRLQQVSEELTAGEAAEIIHTLNYLELEKVRDLTTLLYAYAKQIEATVGAGISVTDMEKCMRVLPLLPRTLAHRIVIQASPALVELIRTERTLYRLWCATEPSRPGTSEKVGEDSASTPPVAVKEVSREHAAEDTTTLSGEPEATTTTTEEEVKDPEPTTATASSSTPSKKRPPTSPMSMQSIRAEQMQLLHQHLQLHRTLLYVFTHQSETHGGGLGTLQDFLVSTTTTTTTTSTSTDTPSSSSSYVGLARRAGEVSASLRQLWNELLRAVLELSIAKHRYPLTGSVGGLGSISTTTAGVSSSSVETGKEVVVPFLRRVDIASTVRVFHYASYRHIPGLQQLTSRYLTGSPQPPEAKRQTPAERGLEELREVGMIVEALGYFLVPLCIREAPPLSTTGTSSSCAETMTLPSTTEGEVGSMGSASSLPFRRGERRTGKVKSTGIFGALIVLLGDVTPSLWARCVAGDQRVRMAGLACVSRQWMSLTRLGTAIQQEETAEEAAATRSPCSGEEEEKKGEQKKEQDAKETDHREETKAIEDSTPNSSSSRSIFFAEHVTPAVEWAWYTGSASSSSSSPFSLPPLERYIQSSSCHQDASRTARLLQRLVSLSTVLAPAISTAVWSPASVKAMKRVQQGLVAGLVKHYERRQHTGRSKRRNLPVDGSTTRTSSSSAPGTSSEGVMLSLADETVREALTATLCTLVHVRKGRERDHQHGGSPGPTRTTSSFSPSSPTDTNASSLPVSWMWTIAEEQALRELMVDHQLVEEEGSAP